MLKKIWRVIDRVLFTMPSDPPPPPSIPYEYPVKFHEDRRMPPEQRREITTEDARLDALQREEEAYYRRLNAIVQGDLPGLSSMDQTGKPDGCTEWERRYNETFIIYTKIPNDENYWQ